MTELSEQQFFFIKGLCANRVFVTVIPDKAENDPQQNKENYDKNYKEIQNIIDLGFLEDITKKFGEEAQAESRSTLGRTFKAFALTPAAIQMFAPPEGSVN